MKYIVIGLGTFGQVLSAHLTEMGHEVIGVDSSMARVENAKEMVTSAICIDATDQYALRTLPIADADAVFVAIGENFGANVMATALLKQLGAQRVFSRSTSPLHRTVISAIGVHYIVNPEEESAERLATTLEYPRAIGSYRLDSATSMIEMPVPKLYWGRSLGEIDMESRLGVKLIALKRCRKAFSLIGTPEQIPEVMPSYSDDTVLDEGDVFVLMATHKSYRRLMDEVE